MHEHRPAACSGGRREGEEARKEARDVLVHRVPQWKLQGLEVRGQKAHLREHMCVEAAADVGDAGGSQRFPVRWLGSGTDIQRVRDRAEALAPEGDAREVEAEARKESVDEGHSGAASIAARKAFASPRDAQSRYHVHLMRADKRVVVLGLGDTGLLVALGLGARFDVTALTPRPFFLSAQNAGGRLASPATWERIGKIAPGRFRRLDPVTVVQGLAERVDLDARRVAFRAADGSEGSLSYDALVIATGADNGFWRRTILEGSEDEAARRAAERARVEAAERIAIVGGGGSGVSLAASLAERYPRTRVRLFHGGDRLLPAHHARVASKAKAHLEGLGVDVRVGHRAVVPEGGATERMGRGPIHWSTGQAPEEADLVLWALGRARPNSRFLPGQVLDAQGFVPVRATLQLPEHDEVFCVGDLAATDPLRSSARNGGTSVVVANVTRVLRGRRPRRSYHAPPHRWGELVTSPRNGMLLFTPGGRRVRLANWFLRPVILDFVLFRLIYGGVRPDDAS